MQVTAPPWPSTPGNTHLILPLQPTLLSRAHTRAKVSTITRQEMLAAWFFVHCEVMPVRHCSRAPGEHEGPRRKGRRCKGRRCWCLKARGPKVQGPKAQGPKVLVFVCVYEGCRRPRAWRRALAPVSELVVVPAMISCDSSSDAYHTGRSSRQGAGGLRASYDRRVLQAVKPSARWGRGEGGHSSTFSCR